jgi:hypothetical protein
MLAPVVVARTAGLGGGDTGLDAVMVMSLNGDTVGASPALAAAMAPRSSTFSTRRRQAGRCSRRPAGGCASGCRRRIDPVGRRDLALRARPKSSTGRCADGS